MPLHFSDDEMESRRVRVAAELTEADLDALLMFKQESMYWLSGYDTFGFALFQCLVMTAARDVALLTLAPDRGAADNTSDIDSVRIWVDVGGANPARDLMAMLSELGVANSRLGIEFDSYGLKASNWRLVEAELVGRGEWVDEFTVVQELRRSKSAMELEYIRRAAELADDAWDAAVERAEPGVLEADVLADMQGAILRGGDDYAGNEIIIGLGPGALMVRYTSGRRNLGVDDQLTLEWCGAQCRYHAAMMRTMPIGTPDAEQGKMHAACAEPLLACENAVAPGRTMDDVFQVHADVLDAAGLGHRRLHACGYGMGAVYAPIWVDWPMIYQGNPLTFGTEQAYFLHMIVLDPDRQKAMTLGHTVIVNDEGCERLSRSSLELVTR